MKVLVLGAGGPAGVNVCRALNDAGHEAVAHDQNREHLVWTEPYATPVQDMASVRPDVVMAQPDPLVARLAYEPIGAYPTFLPKSQTVTLCQDKFECGLAWRRAGLREDRIELLDSILVWQDAQPGKWLRARRGAGAKAAIRPRTEIQAISWVQFWRDREPGIDFVVEGNLPGRDYSWCGIYRDGELLVHFARERLEYLYPHLTPEGLTGTPTRAVVVDSADVNGMAEAAVLAVDEKPHGVFCVDLREDEDGTPRPTEINAGRFSTTVGLWSLYSEHSNFVALAAELAVGDESRLSDWRGLPEGLTLSRHIDCGHVFTQVRVAV